MKKVIATLLLLISCMTANTEQAGRIAPRNAISKHLPINARILNWDDSVVQLICFQERKPDGAEFGCVQIMLDEYGHPEAIGCRY